MQSMGVRRDIFKLNNWVYLQLNRYSSVLIESYHDNNNMSDSDE